MSGSPVQTVKNTHNNKTQLFVQGLAEYLPTMPCEAPRFNPQHQGGKVRSLPNHLPTFNTKVRQKYEFMFYH